MVCSVNDRGRGLRMLVHDMVEHGSRAIEQVHRKTADRTFFALAEIAPIAKPVAVVHALHGAHLTAVYGAIRLANRGISAGLDLVPTSKPE